MDLIATFLPSEVVESLYTTMNKIGLEVVSITLEPIAAINAAIPENLRLLNLVMVDIGAGTSDIAACTGGSVTGYTMATVAGDEVTETIMREYLVDFGTAEEMKAQIEQEEVVTFTDILGFERKASKEEVLQCIQSTTELLSKEIAQKVLEVNGGAPSALFLAGGGSKLAGLKEGITAALSMDANRVAIAGNNFKISAFSDEYDLNNPEYTTPLGITVSSGLNLINDSFRVTLNGRAAKLFRSGSFTALNLLMMNGYNFQDILGRPGTSLTVTVNGKRKVFYGTAAMPSSLFINKKEGKLSAVINAGDCIDFEPAVPGIPAKACLGDIEGADACAEITLNGKVMPLDTPLKFGDVIRVRMPKKETVEEESIKEAAKEETVQEESAAKVDMVGETMQEEAETAERMAKKDRVTGGTVAEDGIAGETVKEDMTGETMQEESVTEEDMTRKMMREESVTEEVAAAGSMSAKEPVQEVPGAGNAVRTGPGDVSGTDAADGLEDSFAAENVFKPEDSPALENVLEPEDSIALENVLDSEDSFAVEDVLEPEDLSGADVKSGAGSVYRAEVVSEAEHAESEGSKFEDVEAVIRESGLLGSRGRRSKRAGEGQMVLNFGQEEKKEPEMVSFRLNGSALRLPVKEDGNPYYLMDMIQYSGINVRNPKGKINLAVNGEPGMFQQALKPGDDIVIEEGEL